MLRCGGVKVTTGSLHVVVPEVTASQLSTVVRSGETKVDSTTSPAASTTCTTATLPNPRPNGLLVFEGGTLPFTVQGANVRADGTLVLDIRPIGAMPETIEERQINIEGDKANAAISHGGTHDCRVSAPETVAFPAPLPSIAGIGVGLKPRVADHIRIPTIGPSGVIVPIAGTIG